LSRSGDGVIAVFRNKAEASVVNIQLPLIPEGKFAVHSVISNKDVGAFTKEDWVRGVPVQFSGAQTVEVLEVRAVK